MNRVVEKRAELTDIICGLSIPIIFTILWIYGVPLMKLIGVLVFVCILVCSIGYVIISRHNKKLLLDLESKLINI